MRVFMDAVELALESHLAEPAGIRHVERFDLEERVENGVRDVEPFGMSSERRLAFEMALHEEQERRALQGELLALEQAWRDAEEIAKIADNLLVPESDEEWLRKQREKE